LLRLAGIAGREDFREKAERSLRLFGERFHQQPQAVPFMLQALDFWLEEPKRVVVVGDHLCSSTRVLLDAAHSVYQPRKIVLSNRGAVEPFAKTLPVNNECSVAFLCTGTACQPPTREANQVKAFLSSRSGDENRSQRP